MRLYNAGVYASNFDERGRVISKLTPREVELRASGAQNILESYHYIGKDSAVRKIRADGRKVFLDSGAFSAFSLGSEIDLGEYCDYIHKNADIIDFPSVLDAIGDPEGTYHNQVEMERRGVNPLPCYHFGEPEVILKYYAENYPYITIGGMVPVSTPKLKIWLDRLWRDYLTNEDGTPKLKVHGFGLTSLPLMQRYPWYSVDSSTWVQWAANGMILIEGVGQVDVSNRSSRRKHAGQHIDTVTPIERQRIEAAISNEGVDPDRLRETYVARWAWNLWAFPHYVRNKHWEGDKFLTAEQELF